MGAGASSLQRARKVLVIRAYNARAPEETLFEQFDKISKKTSQGKQIIRIDDVKKALGLSKAEWFDEIILRVSQNEVRGISIPLHRVLRIPNHDYASL